MNLALRIIPEYEKACRYLLFEWFLRNTLVYSLPKLRNAFRMIGKGQWAVSLIMNFWFQKDILSTIVPVCALSQRSKFIFDITGIMMRNDLIANLQTIATHLEFNTVHLIESHIFFHRSVSAVAYFTLHDWCKEFDDHHSLQECLDVLQEAFAKIGQEAAYLKIQTSLYPNNKPAVHEDEQHQPPSSQARSRSNSPCKKSPITKARQRSKSVTPNLPQYKSILDTSKTMDTQELSDILKTAHQNLYPQTKLAGPKQNITMPTAEPQQKKIRIQSPLP